MSSISKKGLIARVRRGRAARSRMVESNIGETIAFQIRATRDSRGLNQAQLAEAAGMTQNNVSRLESPEYGKYTLTSLRRIADALDVALDVRFVPYSKYIDWLSGTPYIDEGLRPKALAVPSFDEEESLNVFDKEFSYWEVLTNQSSMVTFNQPLSAQGFCGAMLPGQSQNLPTSNSGPQIAVIYPIEQRRAG